MVNPESDENEKLAIELIQDDDDEDMVDAITYSQMSEGGATVGSLAGSSTVRWAIVVVMVLVTLIVML